MLSPTIPGPRLLGATLAALLCVLLLAAAPTASAGVTDSLNKLQQAGKIDVVAAKDARKNYLAARSLRKRSKGAARTVMTNQLRQVESLSRRGRITADRVRPLFTQMQVNVDWFKKRGPAASGTRSRFGSSRIYWQYFPHWGWQFHPLANFARLNAVWTDKSAAARRALGKYAHELIGFGVTRGRTLVWEYYFPFNGSPAPFISSISQGTAIQSLARSGNALADPEITAAAVRGARAFEKSAPTGLRVKRDGGWHYLGYSGNRRAIIFNMFAQALIGLHGFAQITEDPTGTRLFERGMAAAKNELPKSDTGAWSLYQLRGVESNLNYHQLLTGFLQNLCDDTGGEAWLCALAARMNGYLTQKPKMTGAVKRIRRGRIYVTFRLSKVSTVTMRTPGGGRAVATVGRGKRVFSVKKARSKRVTLEARDLAGNTQRLSK